MGLHGINDIPALPEFMRQAAPDTEGVVRIAAPTGDKMWLVRSYPLARAVLTDARFSRAAAVRPEAPKFNDAQPTADSMMSMDGSEHTRLRRIVTAAFTTRRVARLAPFVERLTDGYLNNLEQTGSPADLITGLANPLPLAVLCALLGIPTEDISRFRDCVEVLFDISASGPREKSRRRLELVGYIADLVERKRSEPGDDLLTELIEAEHRGELSAAELVTLGVTLLTAGYETTVGQLGLSVLMLLIDPDVQQRLTADHAAVEPAIEEFLRLSPATPVSFARVARETVHLGAHTIAAGDAVVVSLLHGNRDPATFPEPDHLKPGERTAVHLTFGHGTHRCLGAPLARLQLQIAMARLLHRFPTLRLAADDPVSWKDGLATCGISRLMVAW